MQAKQRVTNNLGYNTARTQEESYADIETRLGAQAKCTDGKHEGERLLPVRSFYLNKGGKGLQGACITCQKARRAGRILRARSKFEGKTKDEIYALYLQTYGATKTCSKCKAAKAPSEFPTSIGMETGLHNHCLVCSIGCSQGNGGLRDFIFLPDKDGIKYVKKPACEVCGGTDKLAVDHILPIAKGGTDCIGNKQTLCVHCNSKKSDTINCAVSVDNLCARYRPAAAAYNFQDFTALSQALAKNVYEFRKGHIDNATIEEITASLKEYSKRNNLGHNLARIVGKIAVLFNKRVCC